MRIALVQMSLDPSRSRNQRRAVALMARAAELDPVPGVICLPALCDGGTDAKRRATLTSAMTDTFLETIAGTARELGVSIVFGFSDVQDDQIFDAAAWIDADGDVLIKHRKISVSAKGCGALSRGSSVSVRDTLFGRMAVAVSDDACTPGLLSAMAAAGATVVFAPCYYRDDGAFLERMASLAARHRLCIVATNSVGPAGGGGHSAVVTPAGRYLGRIEACHERVCGVTVDGEV